jgi:hypothetical protein
MHSCDYWNLLPDELFTNNILLYLTGLERNLVRHVAQRYRRLSPSSQLKGTLLSQCIELPDKEIGIRLYWWGLSVGYTPTVLDLITASKTDNVEAIKSILANTSIKHDDYTHIERPALRNCSFQVLRYTSLEATNKHLKETGSYAREEWFTWLRFEIFGPDLPGATIIRMNQLLGGKLINSRFALPFDLSNHVRHFKDRVETRSEFITIDDFTELATSLRYFISCFLQWHQTDQLTPAPNYQVTTDEISDLVTILEESSASPGEKSILYSLWNFDFDCLDAAIAYDYDLGRTLSKKGLS